MSADTALFQVVHRLEKSLGHKEIALGAFLDIEGAFDNNYFNPYPTSVKLFFVATIRSSPRDGPLNRWACLTTPLFKSLGLFNDALDNTRL